MSEFIEALVTLKKDLEAIKGSPMAYLPNNKETEYSDGILQAAWNIADCAQNIAQSKGSIGSNLLSLKANFSYMGKDWTPEILDEKTYKVGVALKNFINIALVDEEAKEYGLPMDDLSHIYVNLIERLSAYTDKAQDDILLKEDKPLILEKPLKVISVFFSGTGHEISNKTTLAGLLHDHTQDTKLGYDGCAITGGDFWGGIFGRNTTEQCDPVIEQVKDEIKKGNKVVLNAYGHSRGAVSALLLAKQLGDIDPSLLEINLALHDPVPGNFMTTVAIDPFGTTLANKAMDLSDCKTLKHVLALYPSEPLPAIAAHVPLFPTYPKDTLVTESAIAGCHANAQRLTRARNGQNYKMDANTFIPFARMVDFFETHGTTFKKFSPTTYVDDWDVEWDVDRDIDSKEDRKKFLLDIYKSKANNEDISKASRSCHSSPGTVLIKTKSEITDYFNAHHQELANVPRDNATCRVAIEHKHNRVPSLIKEYPKTWQFLKWTAVSVGITASLFLTGGLSALVGLIGVSLASAVGTAIGLTATALTVGGVLSGLWYGVLKPLVHQMAYPSFKVHQTPEVLPENNEIIGSSYENLNVLLKVDKQIIRQLSDSNERSLSTSENDKKIDEVDDILIEDLNDNVSMSF